ncbi:hypothetical protein BH11ACT3_BH11ACT3_19710 [soil metagenome]
MDHYAITSGEKSLEFLCTRRDAQGDADVLAVTFADIGLSASVVVESTEMGFEDLAEFFSEMRYSWAGWTGDVVYESFDHTLVLSAHHDGAIQLSVDLVPRDAVEWHAHGELTLEPSELAAIVAGVDAVVGARLSA